jgi:hypothetical protein
MPVSIRQQIVTQLDALFKTILTTTYLTRVSAFAVPLANMKISAVDGSAFLDCGSLGAALLTHLGERVTVTDSAGKTITGFIKTAGTGVMPSDLLNEDCSEVSDWIDGDFETGVSSVDPAGQFKFDTGDGADEGNPYTRRARTISSLPDQFTLEIKTYFDALGAANNHFRLMCGTASWVFRVDFRSDGILIYKAGAGTTEVGTDIVKCNAAADWQTWRFEVDKRGGEASATVEVFLDDVSQGTFDCDYEVAYTNGLMVLQQYGYTTDNMVSHIDHIKVATGLFPAATGVTIVSASGGTTYNWTSKDAAFNYNDPSGYTVTIAAPYESSIGTNVFWWRDTDNNPLTQAELPAMTCRDTADVVVRAIGQHEHTLTIEAIASLRSSDSGDSARDAAADIIRALGTNVSPNTCLGGYAEDISPIASEVIEVVHEGIKGFGVALRFEVTYVTAPFDPYTQV